MLAGSAPRPPGSAWLCGRRVRDGVVPAADTGELGAQGVGLGLRPVGPGAQVGAGFLDRGGAGLEHGAQLVAVPLGGGPLAGGILAGLLELPSGVGAGPVGLGPGGGLGRLGPGGFPLGLAGVGADLVPVGLGGGSILAGLLDRGVPLGAGGRDLGGGVGADLGDLGGVLADGGGQVIPGLGLIQAGRHVLGGAVGGRAQLLGSAGALLG